MFHIVGTNHDLQHDGEPREIDKDQARKGRTRLQAYLRRLAKEISPALIAEELNEQYLTYKKANSIVKAVADTLPIPNGHRFCDPDFQERVRFGVPFQADTPAQRVALNLFKECYWLLSLVAFKDQTVLFVCGADHVVSFARLLRSKGIPVRVRKRYFGRKLLKTA